MRQIIFLFECILEEKYWRGIYFTTLYPFSVLVSSDPKLHSGGTWERDFWGGSNTFNDSSAAREGRERPQEKSDLVGLQIFQQKPGKGSEQSIHRSSYDGIKKSEFSELQIYLIL